VSTEELLRRAAATLRDPYRNTTGWDLPLADWLDHEAQWLGATPSTSHPNPRALAVARAVLREETS